MHVTLGIEFPCLDSLILQRVQRIRQKSPDKNGMQESRLVPALLTHGLVMEQGPLFQNLNNERERIKFRFLPSHWTGFSMKILTFVCLSLPPDKILRQNLSRGGFFGERTLEIAREIDIHIHVLKLHAE